MTASELPDRLFDALAKEILARWPEYVHSRFTVAEIYQNLIPWRTHRETMDIATSGEYEQALLRLLAGEGDYLALESKAARDEIQAELGRRFPNTGIYRDFAAVGVRLNPGRLLVPEEGAGGAGATGPAAADKTAASRGDGSAAAAGGSLTGASRPAVATGTAGSRAGAGSPAGVAPAGRTQPDEAEDAGRACSGCNQQLPRMEGVRFCPFCGQNTRIVACASCGMVVEAEWTYCVGCGTRAER